MDVATKTFDQVVREFEQAEMELDIEIKEIIDKIHKNATKEERQLKSSSEFVQWENQNKEALARNKDCIKDLEFRKAKLRSKYYYQPATSHFINRVKKFRAYAESKSVGF